ncbi:nuclear factor 7, brain [Salmo trutta]|uniref:nuclear factor 7, brain n=1 Tax=Salmo trutta TaxID=8032 RepID=UPI00113294F7|nr:nuclear factor 7, brain-like [Salmo trutta]
MATASPLTDNLRCSICTEVFTEPVSLNCQHTFCKSCIQQSLKALQQCPLCGSCLFRDSTFEINKPKPKPRLKPKPEGVEQSSDHGEWRQRTTAGQDMCSKHNEILQLFCDTDKRLICVVCRDGRAHEGHKFKPVKEAQDDIMEKLVSDLIYLQEDINMVVRFLESERGITANMRERNVRLKAEISSQFEELREQLRLREEQAMREIEDMDMDFETKLTEIEEVLAEGWERQAILKSAMNIAEPREFVMWWTEKGEAEARLVREVGKLQGHLMRKCPPPSPQKPWTILGLSATQSKPSITLPNSVMIQHGPAGTELQSLLGFLDSEGLKKSLSRSISQPTETKSNHLFFKKSYSKKDKSKFHVSF